MKIQGRTFVISGGASGLGQACVEDICANGGHVAILDMNEETGQELVKKLGSSARFFECNVLETESVSKAVQGAAQWAKETGKPLGGVIAAAGVSTPATMLDRNGAAFSLDDFDFVINVNLRGTIDLVRQTLEHLAKVDPEGSDGERGVVIMVASSAAFDGQKGQVSYSASKGAVTAMTLPMARDLARYGIRVVTIAPSLFDSRMTSVMPEKVKKSLEGAMEFPKRAGQPKEFAQLARQGIENVMLNGVVIRLDGAMRMPSKICIIVIAKPIAAPTMAPTKVAILDDYQGVADPFFKKLDTSKYEVVSIKDTLLPYNHPDSSHSNKDALVERLKPFDVICTMRERTPFPRELIEQLPSLKLLLTTAFRNRSLDLDTLKERGIPVAGTVDKPRSGKPVLAGTGSTTQHCVTLILSLARGIARDDAAIKEGLWQTGLATDLSGKTLGVLGLGRLGSAVARILNVALGMKIIAWSSNLTQEAADEKAREAGLPVEDGEGEKTFKVVSRDDFFRTADVVSVHLVLSDRTRGIVNKEDLAKMKSTALFVNTSRGPLVVERDLLDHLKDGRIRGAAVDVFEPEPLPADSEWRNKNWGRDGSSQVLVTPHMGYCEEDTIKSWYEQQVENIERWAANEPLHNVFT
ncbi:glycerate dehydrogenase [Fusarium agapanthi]|uniref:Glycerate dehydrogenase n=1 Tax=Fusarium agapanthi TaxID=1803897 RepID=A0A9P5B7E2_9HYPO|nr:glycerate dehydrogenase [Fusarium agapanthi]